MEHEKMMKYYMMWSVVWNEVETDMKRGKEMEGARKRTLVERRRKVKSRTE